MPARPRTSLTCLAAVTAALTLAGCAGSDEVEVVQEDTGAATQPGPGGAPSGDPGAVQADLTISVDDGAGTKSTYTLTCGPAGGDVADPETACEALAEAGDDAFAPVPDDVACTEQFGGPETATVTGTVDGEPVQAEFDRTNGCEISRWETVETLAGPIVSQDS